MSKAMVYDNNYIKVFILIALVCLFFLPLPAGTLWWRELFNSCHTILFLFIALVLYSQISSIKNFSSPGTTCLFVLVAGLIVGAAIEVSQGLLQRETSLVDLTNDFYGILAGLALALLTRQKRGRYKFVLIVIAFGFITVGMYSFIQISWHYVQRSKSYPILVAFDESWSTSFLQFKNTELLENTRVQNSNEIKHHRIKFDIGRYSGISIIEPEQNWSTYRLLRFSVYSANEDNIKLVLRVHDKHHNQNHDDRFNRAYIIRPGMNSIDVNISQIQNAPYGRKMDITNIAGVQLFLNRVTAPVFLDISDIFIDM